MKLFTDEESEYMCRDSRPVPMELRQEVFDMLIGDEHISKFNPMKKKGKGGGGDDKGDDPMNPFKKSYHTPANINIYCNAVCQREGLNPVSFLKEYNQVYDKMVKDIPIPYNTEKLTERYSNNAMDNEMRDIGTDTDAMKPEMRDMGTDPMEFKDIPRGRPGAGMIYNFITGEYEPRRGDVVIVNEDPDDMTLNRVRDAIREL